jgi:ribosomal protein S18 acetylase RimI-like enzyme
MSGTVIPENSVTARAREWRDAGHAAVCDSIEPWAHGTIARASRYPTYYDFNVLRVEEDVEKATRLLWMLQQAPVPSGDAGPAVEEVDYDETEELRLSWHLEDFAETEYERFRIGAREIAMAKGTRVLIIREQGEPIAFTQVQWDGGSAEINGVYVHPEHRGRGLGTAITRAAIAVASEAEDLWIVADDEDRPKDLYARLGFRTVWTTIEFLRLP